MSMLRAVRAKKQADALSRAVQRAERHAALMAQHREHRKRAA